jgi:hypothetical protein
MSEQSHGLSVEERSRGLINILFTHLPEKFEERYEKPHSEHPDRDLNPESYEYEAEVLTTRLRCSETLLIQSGMLLS